MSESQTNIGPYPVNRSAAANVVKKFREAFESWPSSKWRHYCDNGDLIFIDGNAASASYLVISKSPWVAGTESWIETIEDFQLPVECSWGAHLSQRTLGQDVSFEIVDIAPELPAIADIPIASISQTLTEVTITFASPHGLVVGKSIGVWNCSDSRLNYPSLVVSSVPSPTEIRSTSGPGGTLASLSISNPAGAKGAVYFRERLGRARNGMSWIVENTTATQSSVHVRSESGDTLPSGTVNTNHSITTGSFASTQLVNAAYMYAFAPTTEFRMIAQSDRVQWSDIGVDAVTQANNRLMRNQVCPDPDAQYKFRVRASNTKGLTVLNANIVSAAKTGTTTATVTTATPHGLVANDPVVIYGTRDQTNFANLTTATSVASVTNDTTFTIVWGSAVTATTYGGVVAKVQGGNLLSSLGVATQVVSTAALTTLADGTRQLTLVGNGSWAAPHATIGNMIELAGCRVDTTGVNLGVDGPWKVANAATTTLTLVLPYPNQRALPADFATTNAGGAVTLRTCTRLSFVRIFDFERTRVELLPRPSGDVAAASPVSVQGTPAVTISSGTVTTVTTVTTVAAVTSSNTGIPGIIADVASAAITSTATTAAVTPTFGCSYQVNIPVTAVSGTTPTLDVSIEESDDSGTNWFKVYDFPRITANGIYRSPLIPLIGNRVRYVQTITGTTPSFTRAINRLQSSAESVPIRQLIDRTIVLTTLNSTTPSLITQDCGNRVQLVVNVGAITTTAPQLQLEGSDDNGTTWYNIGSPLTAVASSTVQLTVNDVHSQLIRARVSTAGVGVTAGYVLVKGHD